MNNIEFTQKIKATATDYKTLYVMGCFGSPMNRANKERYCNNHSYNKRKDRTEMIQAATPDTFGFDCVCLIKGILWGWNGNKNATYGGAKYESNGVPDVGCDYMIAACSDISTDFNNIEIGEVVWMPGHIGVYIGDGLAVECTPKWDNCVQITACNRTVKGYHRRNWTKHGKLPYVTYVSQSVTPIPTKDVKCDVKVRQLQKGSKGSDVRALQTLLIGYGYSCGRYGADGDFGNDTEVATIKFQKKAFPNQPKEWDGIVGPASWNKLLGVN